MSPIFFTRSDSLPTARDSYRHAAMYGAAVQLAYIRPGEPNIARANLCRQRIGGIQRNQPHSTINPELHIRLRVRDSSSYSPH